MRMTLIALLLLAAAGCRSTQRTSSAGASNAPDVTVGFHLAGDEPREGWTQMTPRDGESIYVCPDSVISQHDIISACAEADERGRYRVAVRFSDAAAERLREVTRENLGRRLAILVGGELVAAAKIHSPVGETAWISGRFSAQRAQEIADALNKGT